MLLMQLLEHWLDNYPLAKQAEVLGLKYAGYGRWADAKTGKIVAKTIEGKLKSIKGTGDDTVLSPSESPNSASAEPTAGDSVDGNFSIDSKIDAYMDSPLPISHIQKAHTAY